MGTSILSIVQRFPFFGGRNVWTIYRQGAESIIGGSTVYSTFAAIKSSFLVSTV